MNKVRTILEGYIHNPKKIIGLVVCIVAVFCFLFANAKITLMFQVNALQKENGNLIVYYQKNDNYGFDENTLNVQSVSLTPDKINVNFKLETMKLRDVRLDFDGIEEFGVEKVTVYIGKLKLLTYDAETLSNVIVASNDMEADYLDGELCFQSTGDDSYAILGIANNRISFKFVLLMIPFGLLAGCLIFAVPETLLYYYRKDKVKSKKVVKVAFLLFLTGMIFYSDFELISWLKTKTTDEYMIQTTQKGTITLQNDEIELPFTSHGKKLKEIKIQTSEPNQYDGTVIYQITENGTVIGGEEASIKDIVSESQLVFDVSSLNLKRGTDYVLSISFNLKNEIQLVTNADGTICYRQIFDFVYASLIIVIAIMINIVVFLFGYLVWKKGFQNHLLAVFSMVIGVLLAFIVTPCSMDDEYRHFLRAYEISNGNILIQSVESLPSDTTGVPPVLENGRFVIAAVPNGIDQIKYLDQEANYLEQTYYAEVSSRLSLDELFYQLTTPETGEIKNVSMASTVGLSPLSYLPQIIMLLIGKILGLKPLLLFYLARIGNVIVCTLLIWLAARILPQYKSVIWTVFFIPRITVLRSSCSTDGLLYCLIILLIAYILYLKINRLIWITPKRILVICLLTAYIAIMKLPYVLVAGLVLVLGRGNYRHINKTWQAFLCSFVVICAIGILSLVVYVNVSGIMSSRLGVPEEEISVSEIEEDTDVAEDETEESGSSILQEEHIQYIVQNPKEWLSMIMKEYAGVYQRAKVSINGYFCLGNIYLVMLLFLFASKRNAKYIERIYMLLIAAAIWFGILMVFYRMADPAVQTVPWIGDRYILPVISLVAFAMPQGTKKTDKILNEGLPYALIAVTGANIIQIFTLFY